MTYVAVYGSLREGFGNHRLLKGCEQITTGATVEEFTMHSLGGFPAIVEGGDTNVVVEVYEVNDHTFRRLDMLEGFPSFYNRKEAHVVGMDGQDYTAWIYYMESDGVYVPGGSVVESGDWSEYKSQYTV